MTIDLSTQEVCMLLNDMDDLEHQAELHEVGLTQEFYELQEKLGNLL